MASIREKRPGYWEVRVFVGYDVEGKPVQASKAIKGGRRDAERLAAQLASRPAPRSGKLTVAELLDEHLAHKEPAWSLSSRRDYASRAELSRRALQERAGGGTSRRGRSAGPAVVSPRFLEYGEMFGEGRIQAGIGTASESSSV